MNHPMKAIVTGGTGFLGGALVAKILASEGTVAMVVRRGSHVPSTLRTHPRVTIVEGDLDDVPSWSVPLEGFCADVFFHLAWKGVGNSFRNDPVQISNISFTLDTIRLASNLGCRRWVATGSQAEYGPLNRRISESDLLEPTTLYGASKAATSVLVGPLGRQLEIETVWTRVFSTYGPGDRAGWMLVDIVRQLFERSRPALTPGEQLWDYLYVDDAVEGLIALGATANLSGIFNLGSGRSQTIRSIVEMARDLVDPQLSLGFGEVAYRPDQVMHLEADISKLTSFTGWKPSISMEVGLLRLIESLR